MAYDFKHMTAKQALVLAKASSGRTNVDISELTGFGESEIQRYFSEHDHYYPGVHRLPALCRALGNTVLFDWFKAQVQEMLPTESPLDTASEVARSAVQISAQSGKVCEVADRVIEDNVVEPHEASELDAELAHLEDHTRQARERLQPVIQSGKSGQSHRTHMRKVV